MKINDKFPEFDLEGFHNEKFKRFTNADFVGKWLIVLFYPADFTFVCPTELADAAHFYKDFQDAGAEIISVSIDTKFVHKAWHDSSEAIATVKFPMLADVGGKLSLACGTNIESGEDLGLSTRATFMVDPDGFLKSMEYHDNSIGRNIEEIYRKLQAGIFVRKNNGVLVCPARWKPGQKTLKPGVNLVGKI
jgi:NADH-dependent peroxiredoxin subunit C